MRRFFSSRSVPGEKAPCVAEEGVGGARNGFLFRHVPSCLFCECSTEGNYVCELNNTSMGISGNPTALIIYLSRLLTSVQKSV